jgi:DNA ligase D-like protein (predicted 3'-phosphoesterase)
MAEQQGKLARYRSRRDFRRTSEPAGRRGGPKLARDRNPIFVIQQHDATALHFDFRLEVAGVLKSWAVPKGPSTDPRVKRLAVETEDHPLAYADFEGVIPRGEYGAGTVIVWDAGPYKNLSTDDDGRAVPIAKALARGSAVVWLEGRKLRGAWALVHAALRGERRNWLLIKQRDEGADARRNPARSERRSVLSGRTLAQVAREGDGHGARPGAAR